MAQAVVQLEPSLVKFCEIDLFRKVLDPSSLEVFWTELTAGAYGTIDRADGLFNLVDGRGYQILYTGGDSEYIELKDTLCLTGRPDRPCKLKISGRDLDCSTIEATLEICALPDHILDYYQEQFQAQLQS